MRTFVDRRLGRSAVLQAVIPPPAKSCAASVYGIVLLDRRGCLAGAAAAATLPGEVDVPPGVDFRTQDLRGYVSGQCRAVGGRHFPLVSAGWIAVKGKRVRVGIYMESGDRHIAPELVDLDMGAVSAILSSQIG